MKRFSKILLAASPALATLFLCAPGIPSGAQRRMFTGRNVAHRGLFRADQSIPENSLAAFSLAAECGYGIELDVQLTKDGKVAVFHDDSLDRMCGVSGAVGDYTLDELRRFPLHGTEHTIPLFSELLELVNGRVPLIVELKNTKRNRELCEKTWALLRAYKGEYCIESFNPLIVAWFRVHAPQVLRGQLASPREEYKDMAKPLPFVLSSCLLNPLARPQFIAYKLVPRPATVRLAELLGAMKVAWTSHGPENEKGQDVVIFEHYRPKIYFK